MPGPTAPSPSSKSGIITNDGGERHIPASRRPDGSTRKEIKIRPGYKPPEDVEVYKNRAADAWKTRGTGGIPGAATVEDDNDNGNAAVDGKAASNKNAKRREARKRAKAGEAKDEKAEGVEAEGVEAEGVEAEGVEAEGVEKEAAENKEAARGQPAEPAPTEGTAVNDGEVEKEKRAKKLQKKLRQARELKEKKDSGESLLPEQFEKVIKINELIRQLHGMGFDAEGERKAP